MPSFPLPLSAALHGKRMLAPMVRVGTLPMRLLAHEYGADVVYTPEIVDKRIIASKRVVNEVLGTIDYIDSKGSLNLRVLPEEKKRLVFQMGTADPELAVKAALTVAQDVGYVDVNCGCPKHFSIQGGMGAALLYNPDKLISILEALVARATVPVTCKIRMLEDRDKTLALVDRIISTGIVALAVHCRTKHMTPQDPGDWSIWEAITERFGHRLPIIANGDIFEGPDMDKALATGKVSSVMLARSAMANPSVFAHPAPLTPIRDVMVRYVQLAVQYDAIFQNAKYVLLQMHPEPKSDQYLRLSKSRSLREMAALFGIEDQFEATIAARDQRRSELLAARASIVAAVSTLEKEEEESLKPAQKRARESPPASSSADDDDAAATAANGDGSAADRDDALLGHRDWNRDGGIAAEFPHMPNAPYIPAHKKRRIDASADPTATTAEPTL
ncbi:hypothetical protein BC828DRAFT_392636 [Blastocladiella britannica]|nr:hypothetical protein BC828DRAFT_392636 [Blastocladiella britannica]